MGMFRAMNVTYFLHKPKANNAWIERYEFMNLPVQLKLYLMMECFQCKVMIGTASLMSRDAIPSFTLS